MPIHIVQQPISLAELAKIAKGQFDDFVKAVVDVELKVMAIGGELHADEEALLLANGSKQENLWGINIYPAKSKDDQVEFDSMINVRPAQNNRSRSVEDLNLQTSIRALVEKLVKP